MRIHKILAIWNVLSSSLLAAAVVAALKVMVPKQNKRHFSYGKQEIFATPMLIYIFMPDCMPDDALHFISYIMRHSLCCIVVQSSACRKYASDLKIFFYEIGNAIGCCHRYITRQRKIDLQFSSRHRSYKMKMPFEEVRAPPVGVCDVFVCTTLSGNVELKLETIV